MYISKHNLHFNISTFIIYYTKYFPQNSPLFSIISLLFYTFLYLLFLQTYLVFHLSTSYLPILRFPR